MTDKEFVLSIYPKGHFILSSLSYTLFIFDDKITEEGRDFAIIKKPESEEEGWSIAKKLVYGRMMKKLEQ